MEIHFLFLVLGALVGLLVNARCGWNPWAMIGSASLMVLLFPLIWIAMQSDPDVAKSMADSYIAPVANAMPSLLIGDLAGAIAASTYKTLKGLF